MVSRPYRLLILALVFSGSGCTSAINLTPWKERLPRSTPQDPVVEILGLWQPAEGTGLDGLPARGFAGQLLFFNRSNKSPVKVDGDVRIYVFDDYGPVDVQARPIDQFDFIEDTWQAHLHIGTLGPSYNVFIPYSRKENRNQVKCSLRLRLKPEDGPIVFSEMVDVALPGPISSEMKRRAKERSETIDKQVKDALGDLTKSHEKQEALNAAKPSKTSTISLERTRDASGKTVTRLAETKEAASIPAPAEPDRMNNLERKMEQLVDLMSKQQQPTSGTTQPTRNAQSIQQVSAEVRQPTNEPHPLSFRVKQGRPLSNVHSAALQEDEQPQQLRAQSFNQHPLESNPHPLSDPNSTDTAPAQPLRSEHPLAEDRAQVLWDSLSFEGPEPTSPPATFRDHPLEP